MKLNKIEKIFIAVVLLGLIIIGGGILFVLPSYNNIGKAQKTLDSNRQEQAELNQRLSRLDTIDGDITEQKNNAKKLEGGFYPDLTSYEASEIAMTYIKQFGLEAKSISVSGMTTRDLSLEYYVPSEITYNLKTYSQAAREDEEEVQVEGEFTDGGKKYTAVVASLTNAYINDENGNLVEVSKYTDTMKKALKAAVCRFVSTGSIGQTVGAITAQYSVKGKYGDYMKFVDYINTLPKATWIPEVAIPMTTTIKEDDDSDTAFVDESGTVMIGKEANDQEIKVTDDTEIEKSITIYFLCVEPMEPVSTVDAGDTTIVVNQRPAVY